MLHRVRVARLGFRDVSSLVQSSFSRTNNLWASCFRGSYLVHKLRKRFVLTRSDAIDILSCLKKRLYRTRSRGR